MTYIVPLQALSDPTRLALIDRLRRGPASVGHLAEGFAISRPAVSQHLRILVEAGLCQAAARGTRRVYRLNPEGFAQLCHFLDTLRRDAVAIAALSLDQPPGCCQEIAPWKGKITD
ncbi:MAG: ArsR/SmtB family transcription factor [Mangrovicoccus sp.]